MKLNSIYQSVLVEALLKEGVFDPSIFKAIFMAGSPGGGKSFVSEKTMKGFGLKFVNSDSAFEHLLKKANLSMKMPPEEEEERNQVRDKAKSITKQQQRNYLDGRLGLVIDGTGKDYNKIEKQATQLKYLGYDVSMVFVNVPLEVSLERNRNRERTVPDDIVKKSWTAVQNNIGKFQSYFGNSNFTVIDNHGDNAEALAKVSKEVRKFLNSPIKNSIARDWIDAQLEKRRRK